MLAIGRVRYQKSVLDDLFLAYFYHGTAIKTTIRATYGRCRSKASHPTNTCTEVLKRPVALNQDFTKGEIPHTGDVTFLPHTYWSKQSGRWGSSTCRVRQIRDSET